MTSSSEERPPRRVLVYRLGSLGDTIIALPAFHLTARAFPQAERRMLTNFPVSSKAPAAAAILESTGLIHGYIRYTVGLRSITGLLALWWSIVRWRPEVMVCISNTRGIPAAKRDMAFFRLCGIRRIVGMPLTEDMQKTRAGVDPEHPLLYEREASRLLRNLSDLGEASLDEPEGWDLRLTPAEHARATEALAPLAERPFLAISIGTKAQANEWGNGNWHELLSRIATLYPGYGLVICGAAEEAGPSDEVAAGWRALSAHPPLNLCGALTPRQSAAVFARAAVFIGHDSGPGHLASAVQTPCVSIFSGRNQPGIWFPYGKRNRVLYHSVDCQGCQLIVCIEQKKKCILSITVDEVLAEVTGVLPSPNIHLEVR